MSGDNNVVLARFKFLIFVFFFLFLFYCRFGGSNPLVLASYVTFFGFLRTQGRFFYVLNVHKGPGNVVIFPDGFKSCTFCGEACGSM